MKKAFTIFFIGLAISILSVGLFSMEASAATSGTTGDCTWTLEDGVLTISGNGKMGNYDLQWQNGDLFNTAPWGTSIMEVIIENGVTNISGGAFCGCMSLTTVTIGNSVASIGNHAFYGCTGLKSITIPDSVTSIGKWAFYVCKGLTTVTIGNSVTNIGNYAFDGCTSLTSITIPVSVTSIGDFAFSYCKKLTDVWHVGSRANGVIIYIGGNNSYLDYATWHHVDNACDTTCNECGKIRTISHSYDNACDGTCNECGATRRTEHIYDDANDLICNECGYERPPYTPGDLDGEEGVNSADAIYLLYHTLLGSTRYPVNQPVDYTNDGKVDSADAIYLLYHTLLGASRYPL